MTAAQPLRIGLAGLGTVGGGVLRLLDENEALVARRAGRSLQVTAVSARDRSRERGVDLSGLAWEDDATALARRNDVDLVVELIGGADGPALTLARSTIKAGRPLVTANKAMLAHHGAELAEMAETAGVPLRFEAAVAGAIPIVKGLSEGAAANRIARVSGILNGTCNYILSAMEREGRDFAEVLGEAQRLGFAEADPGFDIDGIDAAHKLALLASLAFGTTPDFASVETGGIRAVRLADIEQARALGFRVRLVGVAELVSGRMLQQVRPVLVSEGHPLAGVKGALNAIVLEGNHCGRLVFEGAGAGAGPTASAVVSDCIAIARGERAPPLAMPLADLEVAERGNPDERRGRHYLRLTVADRPGVLAELAATLRDCGVSIESLIQPAATEDRPALVAIVTHNGPEGAVRAAVAAMRALSVVLEPPFMMPIMGDEE